MRTNRILVSRGQQNNNGSREKCNAMSWRARTWRRWQQRIACSVLVVLAASTHALAGVTSQGVTSQGVTSQGVTSQGVTSQGVTSQGVTSQGVTSQGVTSQGVTSQGVTSQGVTSQGVTSQGSTAQPAIELDPSTPWLQGPRLVAWRTERRTFEIAEFYGEKIPAVERDLVTGAATSTNIHPRESVGLHWVEARCADGSCEHRIYRITEVVRDSTDNTMPLHSSNSDVWLYRIEYISELDPSPGDWTSVCASDDRGLGLFVPGQWAADGSWYKGGYTFSCTDGVIAKCVRAWGYKPWKTLESPRHGAVDLRALHLACTRAARAEYCGDGISYTREGTLIDMFDIYGFNIREKGTGFREEATFSIERAESRRRTRIPGKEPRCADRLPNGPTSRPLVTVWSRDRASR